MRSQEPALDGRRVRVTVPRQHIDAQGSVGNARYSGDKSGPEVGNVPQRWPEYRIEPEDDADAGKVRDRAFSERELELA